MGNFDSLCAWSWSLANNGLGTLHIPPNKATASWPSRLLPRLTIATSPLKHCFVVLRSGRWASLVLRCTASEGKVTVCRTHGALTFVYVRKPLAWTVSRFRGTLVGNSHIDLAIESETSPLLQFCLEDRRDFTKWELLRCLEQLGQIPDDTTLAHISLWSHVVLLEMLVRHLS